jgi:hypothetical protein
MRSYFVEGLYVTRKGVDKARKRGEVFGGNLEPFAKQLWALDADEAILIATEEIDGGEWVDGPTVTHLSEEQRMRQQGAPELPGFGLIKPKKR